MVLFEVLGLEGFYYLRFINMRSQSKLSYELRRGIEMLLYIGLRLNAFRVHELQSQKPGKWARAVRALHSLRGLHHAAMT